MIRTVAILVMDLADFSALTIREGPVAARAAAHRFWALGEACTASHAGEFVKGYGDDFMALFPTIDQAKAVAETITRLVPSAAGIGWGEVFVEPGDAWGVEVNRASRLGEDIAGVGQVLLTNAARLNL